MNKRLSVEECESLFKEFSTPAHIRKHCFGVAKAALVLARELNKNGFSLDLELVRGAALMHDLVRLTPDHAKEAAKILNERGYTDEADIIAVHMNYDMARKMEDMREVDIVCFGDRVVKEDQFVGLAARMDYVVEKACGNEKAIKRIRSHQKDTEKLLKEVEKTIGMSIEEMMEKRGDVHELGL